MDGEVRVTLIRHGQSEANATDRWQGQTDSALSEAGRAQAAAVGARLAGVRFDRVVASDLGRARDTAEAWRAAGGAASVELDPAWRELHVGRWEGRTAAEVAQRWPEDLRALKEDPFTPVGGGESWMDLLGRVQPALRRLLESGAREIAVFTHGGVGVMLTAALLEVLTVDRRAVFPIGRLRNTSVTTWAFGPAGPRLLRFNDAAHVALRPAVPESERPRWAHLRTGGAPSATLDETLDAVRGARGPSVRLRAAPEAIRGAIARHVRLPESHLGAPAHGADLRTDPVGSLRLEIFNEERE